MITGTSHFRNRLAAFTYYAAYGFTKRDVLEKIELQEINIGRPPLKAGQTLHVNGQEGRYYTTTQEQKTA